MAERMKYRVRNGEGEELVVPSLAVLHDLYTHGFLADDDLVRAETSPRWVRVSAMPALHGVRERRGDPRRVGLVVAAAVALAVGLGLLLAR
ncbi:hypothetical protein [Anaeromyxobacter sp. Fw109-5]|uniref:hypothetical protein n=1 Tax=Anaeromyxobacter sp. (strain Fw109-5) TaxID=404589 RepID=UPI0000ED7439|nr:hypothetical protein [Anaeromyxobacter sp. Fw109-5]ABS26487.1 conserved hypothetical protein [Anaeromyxobacter sp. Fw109-5]